MTSPLWGFRGSAALGSATGRGSKSGLVSGRNATVLEYLDFKLIRARNGLRLEPAQLGFEGREILDRAVDRREHDGGNTVQPREPAQCELAHPFGRGFTAAAPD